MGTSPADGCVYVGKCHCHWALAWHFMQEHRKLGTGALIARSTNDAVHCVVPRAGAEDQFVSLSDIHRDTCPVLAFHKDSIHSVGAGASRELKVFDSLPPFLSVRHSLEDSPTPSNTKLPNPFLGRHLNLQTRLSQGECQTALADCSGKWRWDKTIRGSS